MSIFDPDSFLDSKVEKDFETRRRDVPDGDYPAHVGKIRISDPISTKNGDRFQLILSWVVDDESARLATGMDEPTVPQKIWLDLDENGNLESGANKNIQLGRVRAAVGQNKAGKAWSPRSLEGAGALVHVGSRTVNEDKEGNPLDEPLTFVEVTRVAKA